MSALQLGEEQRNYEKHKSDNDIDNDMTNSIISTLINELQDLATLPESAQECFVSLARSKLYALASNLQFFKAGVSLSTVDKQLSQQKVQAQQAVNDVPLPTKDLQEQQQDWSQEQLKTSVPTAEQTASSQQSAIDSVPSEVWKKPLKKHTLSDHRAITAFSQEIACHNSFDALSDSSTFPDHYSDSVHEVKKLRKVKRRKNWKWNVDESKRERVERDYGIPWHMI